MAQKQSSPKKQPILLWISKQVALREMLILLTFLTLRKWHNRSSLKEPLVILLVVLVIPLPSMKIFAHLIIN